MNRGAVADVAADVRSGSIAPNAARVLQQRMSVAPPEATVSDQSAARR